MTDRPLEYATPGQPEPPKGSLAIIFLIVFMDLFGFGIIIPLLPFYVHDPEANPLKVTLLFSIYSICQFIGAPILGMISDRFGRKPVLVLSQLGSAFGYALLGAATTFTWQNVGMTMFLVYLSRVIDGFTGGNISTAQAYISDVTSEQNRAKGMAVLGVAFGLGFAGGPFVGGVMGAHSVSLPAYVAACFSALAATITFIRLPESRSSAPTEAEAWLHPSVFKPILRKPVLVQLLLISFSTMAAFVMMESTIGIFLMKVFGYQQRQIGWYFAFIGIIIISVQGGLIGRLTKRLGDWPLAITGPLFVAVGMFLLSATAWFPMLALLLLGGATNATGRSLQGPTLSSLISKFADRKEQGVTFGLYHGLGSLARVIGPVIAGFMYRKHVTGAFLTAAAIVIVASAWTMLVRASAVSRQEAVPTPVS
jgi:DHA1 family tetracycline resistance protein-like MFS transporter